MTADKRLADFERPPINEVVLGMQCELVPGLTTPFLGLFWQTLRDEYPRVEVQPALDPVVETFGQSPPAASVPFRMMSQLETPRCWFVSKDDNDLIQLQQDRLLRNWRRRRDSDEYPRFTVLREHFRAHLHALEAFVNSEQLGSIAPNQCEITYINHIACRDTRDWGALERYFRTWQRPDGFLPLPEEGRFSLRYVISQQGRPLGRLHLSVQPASLARGGAPILVLNLTARGVPLGGGLEGVLAFLDLGHEWIVGAFDEITTPEMHKEWGKRTGQ